MTAYEKVTDLIISKLEAGEIPWRKNWRGFGEPKNLLTQKEYNGINRLILSSIGDEWFLTFKQAQKIGAKIKKGSHGYPICFYSPINSDKEEVPEAEAEKNTNKFVLRYYIVFSTNQMSIEGITIPKSSSLNDNQIIERAEKIINHNNPIIEIGNPSYCPRTDIISMPEIGRFNLSDNYYGSLFHELGHWTGAPHRLNRIQDTKFLSNNYGKEELIAEFTKSFVCQECQLNDSIIDNSAAYIQGWLNIIKGDRKLLLTAAASAQKAADFLLKK